MQTQTPAGVLGRKGSQWHTPQVFEKEVSHAELSHTQHTGQGATKRHSLSSPEITRHGLQLWSGQLELLPCGLSLSWNIPGSKTS